MSHSPFDEPGDADRAVVAASVVPHELPPLRIHHLMIITAVTAVLLTIARLLLPLEELVNEAAAVALYPLGMALAYSVGLACFGLAYYWWRKGLPAFRQPGQWLLIVFPAYVALMLGAWALIQLLMRNPGAAAPFGSFQWFVVAGVLVSVLAGLFYGYGAWQIADTAPWRVFFTLKTLAYIVRIVMVMDGVVLGSSLTAVLSRSVTTIMVVSLLFMATVLAALVVAMIGDFSHRRRHWSHWFGAVLVAGLQLLQLVITAYSWMMIMAES